ncbi:hypothetical protein BJV82DRAFT_583066 [Fennellomyces sp. T-0311]|nr:hypothetical protein BJV82DRAFT_583066 [Fennellomyces sp. T-0311]
MSSMVRKLRRGKGTANLTAGIAVATDLLDVVAGVVVPYGLASATPIGGIRGNRQIVIFLVFVFIIRDIDDNDDRVGGRVYGRFGGIVGGGSRGPVGDERWEL